MSHEIPNILETRISEEKRLFKKILDAVSREDGGLLSKKKILLPQMKTFERFYRHKGRDRKGRM